MRSHHREHHPEELVRTGFCVPFFAGPVPPPGGIISTLRLQSRRTFDTIVEKVEQTPANIVAEIRTRTPMVTVPIADDPVACFPKQARISAKKSTQHIGIEPAALLPNVFQYLNDILPANRHHISNNPRLVERRQGAEKTLANKSIMMPGEPARRDQPFGLT
jgi:hypothetical protein